MKLHEQSTASQDEDLIIQVGDIYEYCSYHPVLCTFMDKKEDEISGISLIDGSTPRSCSLLHCGVRKLTLKDAQNIKEKGPLDDEIANSLPKDMQWWRKNGI